jgi:hypothetical protein
MQYQVSSTWIPIVTNNVPKGESGETGAYNRSLRFHPLMLSSCSGSELVGAARMLELERVRV